ncbi:MAG: hypothetical protein P8R54_06290 [Myxococcota bacterium]|nr:hypothetical protein [Myxococcota bacterium]
MSRLLIMMTLAALLCGCGNDDAPTDDDGADTGGSVFPPGPPVNESWNYAGISGNRSWTYSRIDSAQMIVDDSGSEEVGGSLVNTLLYVVDDAEQQLYFEHTIQWAAGPGIGIEIRSYDGTVYTNPITVADPETFINDVFSTEQPNTVFESTIIGFEPCPNSWSDKWTCLHVQITGGSGEYFVGDWWLADGWGAAIFQPEVESDTWVLRQTNVLE